MMICDACGKKLEGDACANCAVDVEPFEWLGLDDFGEESTAEAMILGQLAELLEDPTIVAGAMQEIDGTMSPMVYYGTRSLAQLIDVDLVPFPKGDRVYEDPIVGRIDGTKTVRELSLAHVLPPQEVITAVVVLIERGIVALRPPMLGHGEFEMVFETGAELDIEILEPVDAVAPPPVVAKPPPPPLKLVPPAATLDLDATRDLTTSVDLPRTSRDLPRTTRDLPRAAPSPRAAAALGSRPRAVASERPGTTKPAKPVISSGNSKAHMLYAQAVDDRSEGNLASALTNIKLALVFDRSNLAYCELFEELSNEMTRLTKGEGQAARVASLFEQATRAEQLNEVDRAIALLKEAIAIQKDPRCLNRLGVILVMRKKDAEQGRELISKAVELDPQNATFKHNLKKFSAQDASVAVAKARQPSLLGLFGRREAKS